MSVRVLVCLHVCLCVCVCTCEHEDVYVTKDKYLRKNLRDVHYRPRNVSSEILIRDDHDISKSSSLQDFTMDFYLHGIPSQWTCQFHKPVAVCIIHNGVQYTWLQPGNGNSSREADCLWFGDDKSNKIRPIRYKYVFGEIQREPNQLPISRGQCLAQLTSRNDKQKCRIIVDSKNNVPSIYISTIQSNVVMYFVSCSVQGAGRVGWARCVAE